MGQNWSPCTPTTLHFDQGLPGNVVSDGTRNNFRVWYEFRPFFLNGRHLIWAIFSIQLTYNHNFGVYTYVFRVKNWMKPLINIGSFLYNEFGKIQDGDRWKLLYNKIRLFIWKTKFVDMLKCYSKEDRYAFKGYLCVSHDLVNFAVIVQKYVASEMHNQYIEF